MTPHDQCNTKRYHAIPSYTMQYYAISYNTKQNHPIPEIQNQYKTIHYHKKLYDTTITQL